MSGIAWRNMFSRRARPEDLDHVPHVCVVTPVFNGEKFIEDTISSVISQSGNFVLHYHIQDGGSTDKTAHIVRKWIRRHRRGGVPIFCKKLNFTFASTPDKGMYDAINKAFARVLPPGSDVLMGWIGADDRVAPGAFTTIFEARKQFPDISLIGGRVSLMDEAGSILGVEPMRGYSRRCMSAGLYDGRMMPFIMQEGTFWFSGLWNAIGGLDTQFRLAGDWDLWRRMARHAHYFSVDTVLGFHRRRAGQLSENLTRYYQEIDSVLDEPLAAANELYAGQRPAKPEPRSARARDDYERIGVEFSRLKVSAVDFNSGPHAATALRYDLGVKRWLRMAAFGGPLRDMQVLTKAGVALRLPVMPVAGFSPPQGAIPELNLPSETRWMQAREADAEIILPRAGHYTISLICRSSVGSQRFAMLADGTPLAHFTLPYYGGLDRDIELRAEGVFTAGSHIVSVRVVDSVVSSNFLLLGNWWMEEVSGTGKGAAAPGQVGAPQLPPLSAAASEPALMREWPRLTVVVLALSPTRSLNDTLASVIRQAYSNLELIVIDRGPAPETEIVLADYLHAITCRLRLPGIEFGETLNRSFEASSGAILVWLQAGDLLAEGALHAAAFEFATSDAELVVGADEIIDEDGAVVQRYLPQIINNIALSVNVPVSVTDGSVAALFGQPGVFFKSSKWEGIGGFADTLGPMISGILKPRNLDRNVRLSIIGHPLSRHLKRHYLADRSEPLAPQRLRVVLVEAGAPDGTTSLSELSRSFRLLGYEVSVQSPDEIGAATGAAQPALFVLNASLAPHLRESLARGGALTAIYASKSWLSGRSAEQDANALQAMGATLILTHDDRAHGVSLPSRPAGGTVVHKVHYGIDLRTFSPGDRMRARQLLALSNERFIIIARGSDGLDRLCASIGLMADPASVLLVLAEDISAPDNPPCPLHRAFGGHNTTRRLYYQAADIFIALDRAEATDIALLEAGASGLPAIASSDDTGGHIIDGITGLSIANDSLGSLAAAIDRLRGDIGLRRRLGSHARLHVANRFGDASSAGHLHAILANLPGLNVRTPGTVSIASEQASRDTSDLPVSWSSNWTPLTGLSPNPDSGPEETGTLTWWTEPSASFLLQFDDTADHILQLCGSNKHVGLKVILHVNGIFLHEVEVPALSDNQARDLQLRVPMVGGLNRIELNFALDGIDLPEHFFLIEGVAVWRCTDTLAGVLADGAVELVSGFGMPEGPFPDQGLPEPFISGVGHRSHLLLRSAVAGHRWIELRVRNNHPIQQLKVWIGARLAGSFLLDEPDLSRLVRLRCKGDFEVGDNPITVEAMNVWPPDAVGRELSFILVHIGLSNTASPPEPDRLRWDLSEGLGSVEEPIPAAGMDKPFRWIAARQARIIVDRGSETPASFAIVYRTPFSSQRALCTLNGGMSEQLEFESTGWSRSSSAPSTLRLAEGRNVIELTFEAWATSPGDDRELCLVLETLTTHPIADRTDSQYKP